MKIDIKNLYHRPNLYTEECHSLTVLKILETSQQNIRDEVCNESAIL